MKNKILFFLQKYFFPEIAKNLSLWDSKVGFSVLCIGAKAKNL